MEHFINYLESFIMAFKKMVKSMVGLALLIVALWGTLYHLTDDVTVFRYLLAGAAVCALNTWIINLSKHKMENVFSIRSGWVIVAGLVLLLYHAGFAAAAVFVAAVMMASPFFWATVCEGIVGLSLLIALAINMA